MIHRLDVFYSAHCPGCPEARHIARQMATSRGDIVVVEHDLDAEAELALAKRYGLIATPAVVIDGHAAIYGVPSRAAIEARVEASRSVAHS